MSFLVIYIHANNLKYYDFNDFTDSKAYFIMHLIADGIVGIAVPFFFIMSGYWFLGLI
jgi:surface polysaccharide O-acyltransferase-like enzyme